MADKNEDPEIKYRKKMTKYIKESLGSDKIIFAELKAFLEYANAIKGTIATMYGSYSYSSLKNALKTSDIATTRIEELGLDIENIDETMKDLNILILTRQNLELWEEEAMKRLEGIKAKIEADHAQFKRMLGYDYKKSKIQYEITEKIDTGITLSLFINGELREWEPFITIDIYNEHTPFKFKTILYDDSIGLKTLTKDGYIIFSSFYFYYKIAREEVAIGKLRVKNVIDLYKKNETEAYGCIVKCYELFNRQRNHSIIFRQFLKYIHLFLPKTS